MRGSGTLVADSDRPGCLNRVCKVLCTSGRRHHSYDGTSRAGGAGLAVRRGREGRWDWAAKESTNSDRRATFSRSCLTSEEEEIPAAVGRASGGESEMFATVGVATSITLSASSASLFRSIELSVDHPDEGKVRGGRS